MESQSFDDSKWRIADLPHDCSIEDLPGTTSPGLVTESLETGSN